MDPAVSFDRAELKNANGTTIRTLTWDEFWAMSLVERVTHLGKGSIKFFLGDQPVKPKDAIKR